MPDRALEPLRVTPLEVRLTPAAYTVDSGEVAGPPPDALLVQPDGQLVVASRADTAAGANGVTLARYGANGTADESFGPGGQYRLPLAVADYLPVEIEPVAGGYAVLLLSQNAVSVARVPLSGAAGATGASAFSVTTIPTPFRATDADLLPTPDGGARVAAVSDSAAVATSVIAPSGQLDALAQKQFGPPAGSVGAARDIKVRPDGTVLLATASLPGGEGGGVRRFRPDGAPDPAFDGDGVQGITPGPVPFASAHQLAVAPDGAVLVYSTSSPDPADPAREQTGVFTRLTPGGAFDPAFGAGGVTLWAADGTDRVATGLVGRPQGDALLTGGRALGANSTPLVARVSERGRVAERLTGATDAEPGAIAAAGLSGDGTQLVVARPTGAARLRLPEFAPEPAAILPPPLPGRSPSSVVLAAPDLGAAAVLSGGPGGTYALDPGAAVPSGFTRGAGARVARADIDGNGRPDAVFASGPGAAEVQVVLDSGEALTLFSPYEADYRGGLFVAARDLDGDNKAEVVISPDRGGGAVVAVYSGAKLATGMTADAQLARYYGVADREFRGGAKVALGDISGDGRPDLVVAAGDGGGPRVSAWENLSVLAGAPQLLSDFFAFDPASRGGADVAVGNFTALGQIAVGAGVGGGPRVRVVDGSGATEVANFFAFDPAERGGVRLGALDRDGDGVDELVAASGPGRPGRVRVYDRAALANATPSLDIDVFAPGDLASGVYVG